LLDKKYILIISIFLISLIFLSFFFGVYVGVFKIGPYSILDNIFDTIVEEQNNSVVVLSNPSSNISSLINIENKNDINKKRVELLSYLFKNDVNYNVGIPTVVEKNIFDDKYSDLRNIDSIDKFIIEMEYGIDSKAYLFLPKIQNENLIIYHQGHSGDFYNGKETIQYFLDNDFAVLAFSMPLTGQNSNPIIESDNFGNFRLLYHDDLKFLKSDNFSPLKLFFEPIFLSLNYLDQNYSFTNYHMVGISGGGWTTGVYSALDPRIEKSFVVAGTAPMFLRFNTPSNFGDYEQMDIDFYKIANYLEQYVMSSSGKDREQVQIFNKNDPCCFSGSDFLIYEDEIQNTLLLIEDGNFSIHIDENNYEHSISSDSLKLISQKIK
tara:strand:+ start:1069 stop:2205 length:1137 start_codon:yes stop_codon:yes gene_type:complete